MHAILDHVEHTTPRMWTFWFQPELALRFEAGQYLELTVPHADTDSRGPTRWMSLSSSPTEPLLGITTAFPASNPSSYKRALRALQPGARVTVGEPIGDFVLPKSSAIPLVFVVGGIGIAPVRSIVHELHLRNEHRAIKLIYSVNAPSELGFTDVFASYPLEFVPVISQPAAGWHGKTGRLTTAHTLELIGDIPGKLIYLSGPQGLIEPLFNSLIASGLPRAQLVLDYFPGY